MEIFIVIMLFVAGLVVMIKGGDWFVDAAVWIATVTGIPPILIGATIVSLATTLPELFVSTIATAQGATDLAIGNAIGSTICNMGFIMAISIILKPGVLNKKLLYSKAILMVGSTIVLYILAKDNVILHYEGWILLSLLGIYILLNIGEASKSMRMGIQDKVEKPSPVKKDILINAGKFLAGIVLIVAGSRLLVDNGIKIAEILNIPEHIVGVTLVALGTSLPELTTAITSIIKGHHGISIGNILGANILNTTMILGASALVSKDGLVINSRNIEFFGNVYNNVPQTSMIDIPVSLAIMTVFILPCLLAGKLRRRHGGSLLTMYVLYIGFLVSISI